MHVIFIVMLLLIVLIHLINMLICAVLDYLLLLTLLRTDACEQHESMYHCIFTFPLGLCVIIVLLLPVAVQLQTALPLTYLRRRVNIYLSKIFHVSTNFICH